MRISDSLFIFLLSPHKMPKNTSVFVHSTPGLFVTAQASSTSFLAGFSISKTYLLNKNSISGKTNSVPIFLRIALTFKKSNHC